MPYKIALIGTGGRSLSYAAAYQKRDDITITALADPNASHRHTMAKRAGLTDDYAEYDDWRDMLREQTALDGAVICSPNHLHAEHAIGYLERGLPIALEKTLAPTKIACESIIDAERSNDGRTLIGFVMRSAPFYTKIQELITRGLIGRIVSIQANELPGVGVSSVMNRSPWRRYRDKSGGSMLEKSSHDLDLLNWIMDCRPISLTSYGNRQIFVTDPELPDHCGDCHLQTACPYYTPHPLRARRRGRRSLAPIYPRGRPLYLQYRQGRARRADAQYRIRERCPRQLRAKLPRDGPARRPQLPRRRHAPGRIWGNLHDAKVHLYRNGPGKEEVFDCSGDGTGHGGGDQPHAYELITMMNEPGSRPRQNAYAGYLSAAMCFGADISVQEKRRIDFRFGEDGFVELA